MIQAAYGASRVTPMAARLSVVSRSAHRVTTPTTSPITMPPTAAVANWSTISPGAKAPLSAAAATAAR